MLKRTAATWLTLGIILCLSAASGCSDGGGGGGGGSRDPNAPNQLSSNCGTVLDGILQNPVHTERAEVGFASFTDTNTISFIVNGEPRRIKLLGLEDEEEDTDNSEAEDIVQELIKEGPAYFFRARKDCVFKDQNGVKTFVGQIFSAKGKSFAEELVSAGVAVPGGTECNAFLVKTCFEALGNGEDVGEDDGNQPPSPTPSATPSPTATPNLTVIDDSDLDGLFPDDDTSFDDELGLDDLMD